MNRVGLLLVVSVLMGGLAALAAFAMASLTSASLSPTSAGLLGVAFGLTAGGRPGRAGPRREGPLGTALLQAVLAGGTASLVTILLQHS